MSSSEECEALAGNSSLGVCLLVAFFVLVSTSGPLSMMFATMVDAKGVRVLTLHFSGLCRG